MLSFKGMKNGLDVLYIGDKGEIGGELKGVPDGEVPDNAEQLNNASVVVERADGEVCPRCRMIRTDIGVDPKLPMLCGRCAKIVEADYPEAVQEGFEN